MDILFVFIVVVLLLIVFTVFLIKALGLFKYEKEDKQKEYEEWLEKEGGKRVFTSIFIILILIMGLIYLIV